MSSSLPTSTSTPFADRTTPPPPPPKTPHAGPPPPPPSNTSTSGSAQTHPPSLTQLSNPPPPDPSEHWVPDILLDKPTSALPPLLSSPEVISAISNTHPSLHPHPLPPHLDRTTSLALHVSTQHAHVLALRESTQSRLLRLHALERQWRDTQKRMDTVLEPWSAKALYRRLGGAEREAEDLCKGLEGSFLEGEGRVSERDLEGFVRRYREGAGVWGRRREWRERWDEGRVWGWR